MSVINRGLGFMMRNSVRIGLTLALLPATGVAGGSWMSYVNETDTRLQADPSVGVSDDREKDYIVGDIDNDGDDDLICVRKEPFTSTGRNTNVLFMNEGGVLIDRTAAYAIDSDVSGDQGFLTPTNDRDVTLADVDGDGWLDVITAVTLTDNASCLHESRREQWRVARSSIRRCSYSADARHCWATILLRCRR